MGVITVPEPPWKLDSFLASNAREGHSFSISVSKDFLKTAVRSHFVSLAVQEMARKQAREIGLEINDSQNLLHLGEYGIHQIDWPHGGGIWLALKTSSLSMRRAIFSTHNCDRADQQAFLLAVWIQWADYVEASM